MDSTVPLWAFVALGLAAPTLALLGVFLSSRAENKRSQRDWLRQAKYEAYTAMFHAYDEMNREFSAHLNLHLEGYEASDIADVKATHARFKYLYERAILLASLRVSLAAQEEMLATWFKVYFHTEAHRLGETPELPDEWGGLDRTRQAVRYDLGVRRDPEAFGGHYDRRTSVPTRRIAYSIQQRWWALRSRLLRYDK